MGKFMEDVKKLLEEKKKEIDSVIEKWIPRKIDENWIKEFFNGKYQHDVEIIQKTIIDPFWDFMDRGGKRWRPFLFLTLLEAFDVKNETCKELVLIPEVIHNGSLIIDDIEDGSETRRGKPCTYKIFGIDVATNVGTWMFFFPVLVMQKLKESLGDVYQKILDVYVQEMNNIHIGQAMDIGWHKGWKKEITKGQYLQMCAYKTGTLARLSSKIAGICGELSDEEIELIGEFGESIGVAFQIQDDILNLTESDLSKGKGGVGEDITEGKRSLIVIRTLSVADESDKNRLLEILDMKTRDRKLISEAIEIIKKYDGIEYSKRKAKEIMKNAWNNVKEIIPDGEAKMKLEKLVLFLVERDI